MNTEQAIRIVERQTPCAHNCYETISDYYIHCHDCDETLLDSQLQRAKDTAKEFEDAIEHLRGRPELSDFQNEVWGSLEKYGKKLGWGLSGTQPECWVLLDKNVDELVRLRETTRTADIKTAASIRPMDQDQLEEITAWSPSEEQSREIFDTYYSIIQLSPSIRRQEGINVGVVLYNSSVQDIRVDYNMGRAKRIFNLWDDEYAIYREALRSLARFFANLETREACDKFVKARCNKFAEARCDSSFTFTEPKKIDFFSPSFSMGNLFSELVIVE